MHTVEECAVDHRLREWLEQVRCLLQVVHALVDIANEYHGRIRLNRLLATGEGAGRHVVLHDLDAVLILEVDTRHLVECDAIPQAHETDLAAAHIVEQVRHSGLSTRNQDRIRREFFIDMRLTGTARPELAGVYVVLNQGDQPSQKMPLDPVFKLGRLHAAGSKEEIDPFLLRKVLPCIDDLVLVQIRHLNWRDVVDDERALILLVLIVEIGQVNNTPDAACQKFVIITDILWMNVNALNSEEQKVRIILIDVLVQLD